MPDHRSVRLGPGGRRRIVEAVEFGMTQKRAAARFCVSPATVNRWVRRAREASPEQRASGACFAERPCRPGHSPRMLSGADHDRVCEVRERTGWGPRLIASEVSLAHATVHRALRRRGCSRRPSAPREAATATSGRARGTCCIWTPSATRALCGRATPEPAIARSTRTAPAGSSSTPSSTTARASPTPRSQTTSGRRPSPPSPSEHSTSSSATGSSPSACSPTMLGATRRTGASASSWAGGRSPTSARGPTARRPTARCVS